MYNILIGDFRIFKSLDESINFIENIDIIYKGKIF